MIHPGSLSAAPAFVQAGGSNIDRAPAPENSVWECYGHGDWEDGSRGEKVFVVLWIPNCCSFSMNVPVNHNDDHSIVISLDL